MAVFFVYPLVSGFMVSLHRVRLFELGTGGEYVGLANYVDALADPVVHNSVGKTLIFASVAVSLELVLGTAIAVLLSNQFRGRRFVRAMALAPMMLTPVVVGLNFRLMFNRLFGVINWILSLVGLGPVSWLADPFWAMVAVICAEVWNQTPFVTLVALAALQVIPEDVTEAAKVDGASPWKEFWHISLPLMVPVLLVAAFWRSVATFRIFDVVSVMTAGGPVDATEMLSLLVAKLGFNRGVFGYSTAIAFLMIVAMLGMAITYNRYLRGQGEELA